MIARIPEMNSKLLNEQVISSHNSADKMISDSELFKKFSPEPGLVFVQEYQFPNGSVFKG